MCSAHTAFSRESVPWLLCIWRAMGSSAGGGFWALWGWAPAVCLCSIRTGGTWCVLESLSSPLGQVPASLLCLQVCAFVLWSLCTVFSSSCVGVVCLLVLRSVASGCALFPGFLLCVSDYLSAPLSPVHLRGAVLSWEPRWVWSASRGVWPLLSGSVSSGGPFPASCRLPVLSHLWPGSSPSCGSLWWSWEGQQLGDVVYRLS